MTTNSLLLDDNEESFEELLKKAHSICDPGQKNLIASSLMRKLKNNNTTADIYHQIALLLLKLERFGDARDLGARMVFLWPYSELSHFYLALALLELKFFLESEKSFKQALFLKPDMVVSIENLYCIYCMQGELGKVTNLLEQAKEVLGNSDQIEILNNLVLPTIALSAHQIQEKRENFIAQIQKMHFREDNLQKHIKTFNLAYQNMPNKEVMIAMAKLIRQTMPEVNYTLEKKFQNRHKISSKIRIGFISDFLHDHHTIGKLYGGLLKKLDRQFFEVITFQGPGIKHEASTNWIKGHSDRQIVLTGTLVEQQMAIAAEGLDVLFFTDIGMSLPTYLLSFSRFAPVQIVSWGHPDTTGVDTLDYFISSSLIEREDALGDYSESLVLFNRLPCYYYARAIPEKIFSRQVFGLPPKARLYGCPQSLFKIHPEFDEILAKIAEGDPDGNIVLIEGSHDSWTKLLKERWAIKFPILNERVIFLKRQPADRFIMLLSHFDVLLDPIHFGSGNTFYESMIYGTPSITWPGQFMRGRIVAGAYHQMNIANPPIASSFEDYVMLALGLAKDSERLNIIKRKLRKAARKYLFTDNLFVKEFQEFIKSAVKERAKFHYSQGNESALTDVIISESGAG